MPKPLAGTKLQTGEQPDPTIQKILARRGTEEMLPFFRDLHLGRSFQVDGARYEMTHVFLDDLKRIIGVGSRTYP